MVRGRLLEPGMRLLERGWLVKWVIISVRMINVYLFTLILAIELPCT